MVDGLIRLLRANDPWFRIVEVHPENELDLDQFCACVQENSYLRHVTICDHDIDTVAAEKLSATLRRMPVLECFQMIDCPWDGVEVATILVSSLADRYLLEELLLSGCDLNDGGMQAFATSFSSHNSLRKLAIEKNYMGNESAIAIGTLLAENKSLKLVNLYGGNIDADGFEAIWGGIAKNATLSFMILDFFAVVFAEVENAFRKAVYNDDSIESVLTGSNHTLQVINAYPKSDELIPLLAMNQDGPETSRRRKIIRFLNENPGSLISMCVNEKIMPSAIEKIGRVGGVGAMNELVRAIMPDIFDRNASRKRSRS